MKNPIRFLVAVILLVSFAFVVPNRKSEKIVVVIDAGHGGKDFGAVADNLSEKQITEQIANRIKELNKNPNIEIKLTRSGDNFLELGERTTIMNNAKPDLVLSLHVNSSKDTATKGMEFFVCYSTKEYEKSSAFAEKLSGKFSKEYEVRGIKNAPFYILKNTTVPAISFEMGFLSNPDDKAYLSDPLKQDEIAATMLDFIKDIK